MDLESATFSSSRAPGEFHGGRTHFPAVGCLFQPLTLVVQFTPLAKSESDLDEAALEEHGKWDKRQAVVLPRFCELAYLATIQQQLSSPLTGVVVDAGFGVFRDVAVNQPDFSVLDPRVCFFDGDLVIADAFDFAASQHDSAVQFVEHVIVVPRAAVAADDLSLGFGISTDGLFGACCCHV
jgi:hypothetical protein